MSSSLSGSSSESSSSPAPTRTKRPVEAESSDSDNSSDESSADEDDTESDAPQPLPSTEVTVLSHAERRRQKRKEKQQLALAATSATESPRKKCKLDDGTASNDTQKTTTAKAEAKTQASAVPDDPRRQKRQNSIWVGNLAFRTTEDALRGFFQGVGTITRVHMPMRRGKQEQGENMGFAYIDFETPDAKTIAITLSESQLDDRNLLIKDGGDFTGRPAKAKTEPFNEDDSTAEGEQASKGVTITEGKSLSKTAQKILHTQKQPPAPTLFLGNLGFETTEGSIRELFEAHRYWGHKDKGKVVEKLANQAEGESQGGEAKSKDVWIRKIRMGTFEDSGACKGFAFIDFTSIEHATEALVNPRNHRLNGRNLVVEYASPDAVRRGGGPRHQRGDQNQKGKGGRVSQKGSACTPYNKERQPRRAEQEDDGETAKIPAEATTVPHSGRPYRAGYDRLQTRRAKPGAALAQAQRQSAAILPGQGQKIVF